MSHENENINPSELEDLNWLAFRYVADELSDTDRDQFETRLEDDHEAREAVVSAMRQAELIWLACDNSSGSNSQTIERVQRTNESDTSRRRSSRATVLAASAVALLLMVVGWGWYVNQDDNSSAMTESENLAVVLAELVEEESEAEMDSDFVEFEIEDSEPSNVEDEMSDWMFVALVDQENEFEGAE